MLAFCTSPEFVRHDTGPHHPDAPTACAIALAVREAGLIDSPNLFPDFDLDLQLSKLAGPELLELTPEPANLEDINASIPNPSSTASATSANSAAASSTRATLRSLATATR